MIDAHTKSPEMNAGGVELARFRYNDSKYPAVKSLAFMSESNTENKTQKLNIDRPQDFKFHIAYGAYSRAWDENTSEATRAKLNELISSLANDESSYSIFYARIQEYRSDSAPIISSRSRIETVKKKDWQRGETQHARNRRHK